MMSGRLRSVFSADLRSLACLRIVLGALVLITLLLRNNWLGDFYTDDGFLPRDARISLTGTPWLLSLHLSSGSPLVVAILYLAALCFALGMLAGYRTRFCVIGSWILFASMHVRNPFIDGLAEDLILGLLFWMMFVPLNARWSVDAALNPEHLRRPNPHFSLGVVALMLQVCMVYWFSTPLQSAELFPQVSWLSPGALTALKVIASALAFLPFGTGAVRLCVVVFFVTLHLAAAGVNDSAWAALVCAGAWTLFLPESFWDLLDVRIAGRVSVQGTLAPAIERLRVLALKGPGWFQRRLAPKPPVGEAGTMGRAIILAALAVTVAGYASTVWASRFKLPASIDAVATMAQLGQPWSVPPQAKARDGWYVVEGEQTNGKRVDVLRGGSVSWARPAEGDRVYSDPRLRRYMMRLLEPGMVGYRPYYAEYLCLRWNIRNLPATRLKTVSMSYVKEAAGGGSPSRPLLLGGTRLK